MSLKKIEYYSQASEAVKSDGMGDLATDLSKRNNSMHVTGWLNFDRTCFYQCIEGESAVIDDLYRKILVDPRHHDIVTLANKPIESRHFQGWSMHVSAGAREETQDTGAREALTRSDDDGVDDLVTSLSLWDMVTLGGDQATHPSMPISKSVEAAGRRWLTLRYRAFVKQFTDRRFEATTELAAAIVENVLLANRRGPSVLPNLKAFLMRRADLSYQEIGKACRKLRAGVSYRSDALDGVGATELISALTAVTFSVRALQELDSDSLRKPAVRRVLVSLCRAALVNDDIDSEQSAGLAGTRSWVEALVG